jgi:hypothetical protein
MMLSAEATEPGHPGQGDGEAPALEAVIDEAGEPGYGDHDDEVDHRRRQERDAGAGAVDYPLWNALPLGAGW